MAHNPTDIDTSGSVTLRHYALRQQLGEGGYGQVFEAWDAKLCRPVAIKRLKTETADADSLLREARLAASLQHPAFVKIYAIEDEDVTPSIVMELVAGDTLRALLQRGPLAAEQAIDIVRQVAEAMQEAHAAKLIHSDLKPSNLIIEPSGKVRILDFGLASQADPQATTSMALADPQGTIAYMAPERLTGAPCSAQGDIYALGVMLYEMLCGARPFANLNGLALAAAHMQSSSAQWEFPDTIEPHLVRLVRDLTARQPEQRVASMEQVCARLSAPDGKSAPPALQRRRLPPALRRGAGAALILAVLGIAIWQTLPYLPQIQVAFTPYSETAELKRGFDALRKHDLPNSFDVATNSFNTILEHDARNAAAAAGLSLTYSLRYASDGQDPLWLQRASASAQQAMALNPHLALSHIALGWTLPHQGKAEQALTEMNRALELDPDNYFAMLGKVGVLRRMQRMEEAKQSALQGIQRHPREVEFRNEIAAIQAISGDISTAEQTYRNNIALAPDNVAAYSRLSSILVRLNRNADALRVLQQGLQVRPSAHLYDALGNALFRQGDYVAAAKAFESAVSPASGNPGYYLYWANLADTLLWIPGRRADASRAYAKAIDLLSPRLPFSPGDFKLVSRLALYHARAGHRTDAISMTDRAIRMAEKDPDVHFRAGLAHELLGNREIALAEIIKARQLGYPIKLIESEPDLLALRRDERYPPP